MSPKRRNFLCGCLLASAGLGAMATPAMAQDTLDNANSGEEEAARPNSGIAEIIVTAQKRQQSANDVPISITTASGGDLLAKGITSTADLAKIVPGLSAPPSPYNVPVYSLRGVGFYESSLSASPTVAVYTDEVPLPFSAMTKAASLDVERVEILKGPQGTLFGNNTTGGAINYIANKPTDEFEAGLDLSYGRFNTFDLQGFVSGPLANGLNARLAARTIQSGDWQKSQTRPGDSLGAQRQWQGRMLLDWEASDRLKFSLNLNGWIDRSDTQAAQLSKIQIAVPGGPKVPALEAQPLAPSNARAADWTSVSGFGPHRKDDYFFQIALRGDYDLTDSLVLTSITAFERYKADANFEFDGTPLKISDVNPRGHINTFSQELRLTGSFDRVNFVIGGNYESDRTFDQLEYEFGDATASTVGPEEISRTGNFTRQNVKTAAVFGNVEWEFVDNLSFTGGIRYTDVRRDFTGCSMDPTAPGTTHLAFNFLQSIFRTDGGFDEIGPNQCWTFRPGFIPYVDDRVRDKLDEDNVSWRAGLSYKTANKGLLYATISKGYKAGSFPTGASTQDIQYTPVKQESLLAYEVGFKQPLLDNRLLLTGAGFYYDYKGKQIRGRLLDIVFGPLDALVQIPKSRVYGFEGQIVAQPFEGFTFNVAATYVNTKIQKFTGFNAIGVVEDFAGSRFPYAPKWQVVADTQYDFPLSENLDAFVGGSLTYNSSTNASVGYPVDYTIPSFTLIDLRAGVQDPDKRWSFQVWGRNITNDYYWTNVVLFNDAIVKYAGRPVTYGASISYRF